MLMKKSKHGVIVKVQTASSRFTIRDYTRNNHNQHPSETFELRTISDLDLCISFTPRPTNEGEVVGYIYVCVCVYTYTNINILIRKC